MNDNTRTRCPALGGRIREARLASGLSHDRLAAAVNSSRQHLIRLEKGVHRPSAPLLAAIARATDTPLEEFAAAAESDAEDEDSEAAMLVDPRDFGAAMQAMLDLAVRAEVRRALRDEVAA